MDEFPPIGAKEIASSASPDRCLHGMDQSIASTLKVDQLRQVVAPQFRPPNADPAFDETEALSRLRGDRAFLRTLALMFVEDAPSLIADIRAAIQQHDAGRLVRAAHKIKGSAYPFCAAAVYAAAQSLESTGQSGELATATAELRRFESAIGLFLNALTELTLRPDDPGVPTLNTVAAAEEVLPCIA